jgi:cytochrome c
VTWRAGALAALALAAGQAFAQGMQIPRPGPGLVPNPATGKKLFAKACAQCHGTELQGTKQGPPLVHRIYEPSHHGDVAFQIAVRYGSRQHHWNFGDMQPVPGLSPDDVAHITAYVRAEQRKAGIR